MAMSEEEYLDGEPNDEEFGDTFLSAEESDGNINMILIPNLEYDLDAVLRSYLKELKKCPTTDEALEVLYDLVQQIKIVNTIESETDEIQDRVEGLRVLMSQVSFR